MLVVNAIVFFVTANLYRLAGRFGKYDAGVCAAFCLLFLAGNIRPALRDRKIPSKRLRICSQGSDLLLLFCVSTAASALYLLSEIGQLFSGEMIVWLLHLLNIFLVEAVVFWNGIVRVYLTSGQLALKWRLLGVICGFIPVINLAVLYHIIKITGREAKLEGEKLLLDEKRKEQRVCATKYPILLVHGVFFRDFKYLNYWGRIPAELEKNGASIFYGNHQSADSVEGSARELAERIRQITEETGCGKLNIIAHSKGGLDCRYALSELGIADRTASLTTINTPHRGCLFADYLLEKIPENIQERAAETYNRTLKILGDEEPDFMKAVRDLTESACMERNRYIKDAEGVYYQSVGSRCNRAVNGRFPLNFTYYLVKYFGGENDGLVSVKSFPWGENFRLMTVKGRRGLSHGDMIDLNRENIPEFDVREFYVSLAADLKQKGF